MSAPNPNPNPNQDGGGCDLGRVAVRDDAQRLRQHRPPERQRTREARILEHPRAGGSGCMARHVVHDTGGPLLEAAAAACPSAKARALDKIEVRASEARAALALQNGRTSGVRAANGGSNGAHEAPGPPQGGTAQSSKDGEDARAADAAYRGGGAALRQGDVAAALGLFRAAAEVCPAGERAARDKIERAVAACQAKLLDQGHQ